MAKTNVRLDAARKGYREALESARRSPTPEAWARLLSAGKELSAAEDPPRSRRGRRPQGRIDAPVESIDPIDRAANPGETLEGLD